MRSAVAQIAALGLASFIGCGQDTLADQAAQEDIGQRDLALLNGIKYNGIKFNGIKYNGIKFNGIKFNGVDLVGVRIGTGSQLEVIASDGSVQPSSLLLDLVLEASLADGSTAELRIDRQWQDATTGLFMYEVLQRGSQSSWQALCPAKKDSPTPALALYGTYDETTGNYAPSSELFTFACTDGALGKCATWGYRPWTAVTECAGSACRAQSLQPWHLACTRMVRADYCGDGVPHTRDGTPINIWDNLNVLRPDPSSWGLEAEWSANGARCIRHTRWQQADKKSSWTDLEYIQRTCPERLAANQPASACTDSTSDFFTSYGLHLDSMQRRVLRNQSEGWLKSAGDAKK